MRIEKAKRRQDMTENIHKAMKKEIDQKWAEKKIQY